MDREDKALKMTDDSPSFRMDIDEKPRPKTKTRGIKRDGDHKNKRP